MNKVFNVAGFLIISTSVLLGQNNLNWIDESEKRLNWFDAVEYCKKNNARLPSVKEFDILWKKNNKASDIKGFDGSVSYWTSNETDNKKGAYPFYFIDGRDGWYYKQDHYGVRCIKNN